MVEHALKALILSRPTHVMEYSIFQTRIQSDPIFSVGAYIRVSVFENAFYLIHYF